MAVFRAIILGGTGQVGAAVLKALVGTPACQEIVLITRTPAAIYTHDTRVRNIVLDSNADDFCHHITELTAGVVASGHHVAGISCVGVGSGSMMWSEEELKQLEIGVVGAYARGLKAAGVRQFCLLSATGANSHSWLRYARVMGMKEENIVAVNFSRTALFQPGIIVGNSHTPRWVEVIGQLVPGAWGNIDQNDMGEAFVTGIRHHATDIGVVRYNNQDMRRLLQQSEHK